MTGDKRRHNIARLPVIVRVTLVCGSEGTGAGDAGVGGGVKEGGVIAGGGGGGYSVKVRENAYTYYHLIII